MKIEVDTAEAEAAQERINDLLAEAVVLRERLAGSDSVKASASLLSNELGRRIRDRARP